MKMYFLRKKDSHFILVDYGGDQITLRIQDEGNKVTCTPVQYYSFQSVSSF